MTVNVLKVTAYFWKKNFKLFLKPRFSEAKFNADSKSGKKKWVSRACFWDNQHLMEAYAGVFEERIVPPEVIRTKINIKL